MRLWHESLIPLLPRNQILGQNRECAALRGLGWGRKHSTVDYVFTHPIEYLVAYHFLVLDEMESRGYKPDHNWSCTQYRGKQIGKDFSLYTFLATDLYLKSKRDKTIIYPEHDNNYLLECIENLKNKGIIIQQKGL